jgi:hypothetical protein
MVHIFDTMKRKMDLPLMQKNAKPQAGALMPWKTSRVYRNWQSRVIKTKFMIDEACGPPRINAPLLL